VFSTITIEGQEVMERTNSLLSVEGKPAKAVLAQTCMGVFLISSASDTISAKIFLPKSPAEANRSGPPAVQGPQFYKQRLKLSL
jgi:hypothetical protein